MHICISKIISIGSDYGLSPGRCQAIIWTSVGILSIWPLGTNFNLNRSSYIFIQENAFENVVWKMVAMLSWPLCVIVGDVLTSSGDFLHWKWFPHDCYFCHFSTVVNFAIMVSCVFLWRILDFLLSGHMQCYGSFLGPQQMCRKISPT